MSRIFGPIKQNGYVVRDIAVSMKHWTDVLGVGPFYYFDRLPLHDFIYDGKSYEMELSVAIAQSGDLQIELIQQRTKTPSLYLDFLAAHGEGLQHVSVWTETFGADSEKYAELGYRVGQQGRIGESRFIYYDTAADHPSTVMELYELSPEPAAFFSHLRRVAANWDGSKPVRTL